MDRVTTKNLRTTEDLTPHEDVWILVPARGGSKGIPRKCVRRLGEMPLIHYVLTELSPLFTPMRVVVSTDDDEIAEVSKPYATIHRRLSSIATDETTLDDVAVHVCRWLTKNGAKKEDFCLTVQPSSPFIRQATVLKCVEELRMGARCVITVTDDRHLRWTIGENGEPVPLFEKRVNRQWLPVTLAETGGVIGARIGDILSKRTRIVDPVALIETDMKEGLDIDTYQHWAIAEYYINRLRIMIRADASPNLGMGHIYRSIALAYEFSEHELKIVTRCDSDYVLGARFLECQPYSVLTIQDEKDFLLLLEKHRPDIVITDVLDTNLQFMEDIKAFASMVVTLEDLGSGARRADLVINDLYTDLVPRENHWYGVQYAILSSHFESIQPMEHINEGVDTILVSFGGTDPQDLTRKTLHALQHLHYPGNVSVILGPGYSHGVVELAPFGLNGYVRRSVANMAVVMQKSDLAITSAGRTVTELMTVGVPTLVLCQNMRELRHTHASSPYGVINLGLGEHIDVVSLAQHIAMLIEDQELRRDMHIRARNAVRDRANRKIAQLILSSFLTRTRGPND